ncbi:MAG: hypothetical protein ABIC04_02980 [Nanoarchaeota archaeon]
MKKRVMSLFLLAILLAFPLILAQEQAKTYSDFGRFIDNVKMFFSLGDKKVMLALDIRGKELDSAIINTKNLDNDNAEKNLERAKERLQFVQNKVSKNIAEEVKTNIDKTISKINEEENLPDNFDTYALEEEKTQLTAKLVIEVEGKEGQTLTREIVKDGESGKNKVKIEVKGDDGQIKVMEIEGKIGEIDNQIAERTFAPGTKGIGEPGSDIKTVIVEEGKDGSGDDGLKPVVKTHVAGDGTGKNDPIPKSDGTDAHYDPSKDVVVTNNIDEGKVDVDYPNNVVDIVDNQIDNPPKSKDNEDVSPEPNVVDNTVDPGPQGIVGSD